MTAGDALNLKQSIKACSRTEIGHKLIQDKNTMLRLCSSTEGFLAGHPDVHVREMWANLQNNHSHSFLTDKTTSFTHKHIFLQTNLSTAKLFSFIFTQIKIERCFSNIQPVTYFFVYISRCQKL